MVTNIFSVAKQAGSTAKAIFNTLQALDEVSERSIIRTAATSHSLHQPTLVNTFAADASDTNGFFERLDETSSTRTDSFPTDEQMQALIGMGFVNRAKNQRLLRENANDLAKVIELLTLESDDDSDWFTRRH